MHQPHKVPDKRSPPPPGNNEPHYTTTERKKLQKERFFAEPRHVEENSTDTDQQVSRQETEQGTVQSLGRLEHSHHQVYNFRGSTGRSRLFSMLEPVWHVHHLTLFEFLVLSHVNHTRAHTSTHARTHPNGK